MNKQIVEQARKEYQAGLDFRHQREADWKRAEDQYFNKQAKSLKQRYNVPVPIVPGFVETLLSKIDDPPIIKFDPAEPADYKITQKVQAYYRIISRKDDYDWDLIDLDAKKQAILYGRAVAKYYAHSKPEYKSNLELVDVYDFIADPIGGGNLEDHRFCGQDNIFKTREQLKDGVKSLGYDKDAVEKIINATGADKLVDNDNVYRSKQSRMMALGLDGITYNFAGQALYKFIEWGTTWKNERYYVLFNYETGTAVKCSPLREVFESGLWWFTSWATHRDKFNFWSKAPVDDIVPLAEMIRVLVNQELDNRQKRNWGMRAYDPDMFPNPAELSWRPDGLVAVKSGAARLNQIRNGVYQFETPELDGTINLVSYIDNIIGEKTGVNADAMGSSEEARVGVYYGNLQQIADRLGLYNKSYKKFWAAVGRRFVWGLKEHLRNPVSVRIIGDKGAKWESLARTEINPEWDVIVEGGNAELAQDDAKQRKILEGMATLQPDELALLSPRWRAETKLRYAMGLDEDDIRMAFDLDATGDKEIISEAHMMIQDVLAGKQVALNRGATTTFVQTLLDYATDEEVSEADYAKLMSLVDAHLPIAEENMARKATRELSQSGNLPKPPAPSEQLMQMDSMRPSEGEAPSDTQGMPANPSETQSLSQQITNQLNPNPR